MSEPFLAEIKMVGFNFAPRGWAFLDGQLLPINQNQSLFSLLGTTFGGDGRTSFALPDLRGRTPLHTGEYAGESYDLGERGGEETVTLTPAQMPQHKHAAEASMNTAAEMTAQAHILAGSPPNTASFQSYNHAEQTTLRGDAIANAGGSQAHQNMQPFLAVNFCIALQGLFPSRN